MEWVIRIRGIPAQIFRNGTVPRVMFQGNMNSTGKFRRISSGIGGHWGNGQNHMMPFQLQMGQENKVYSLIQRYPNLGQIPIMVEIC